MVKRLLTWFRLKRDLAPDDVAARNEAKRVRDNVGTLRAGNREGPPMFDGEKQDRRGS